MRAREPDLQGYTATARPFVWVRPRRHFEQNIRVRHPLERHRAGRAATPIAPLL